MTETTVNPCVSGRRFYKNNTWAIVSCGEPGVALFHFDFDDLPDPLWLCQKHLDESINDEMGEVVR